MPFSCPEFSNIISPGSFIMILARPRVKRRTKRQMPDYASVLPRQSLYRALTKRAGNIMFNIDGFGVAWYSNTRSEFEIGVEGPRAAMYKTVAPM